MLQPTKGADMNEPDTSGEPTAVANDRDGTVERIIDHHAGPTQAAELAWSSEDDTEDYGAPTERYSWTAAWMNAGLLILCAAVLAGVIGIVGVTWVWDHETQAPTPTPTSSPAQLPPAAAPTSPMDPAAPPSLTPPPAPPTVTVQAAPPSTVTVEAPPPSLRAAHRNNKDEAFMSTIRESGIIITDPAEVIAGGHQACEYIAAGHTAHDAMRLAMANNPTLTLENASTLIGAAIGAYCPQYRGF
jgi:hypothetical protein